MMIDTTTELLAPAPFPINCLNMAVMEASSRHRGWPFPSDIVTKPKTNDNRLPLGALMAGDDRFLVLKSDMRQWQRQWQRKEQHQRRLHTLILGVQMPMDCQRWRDRPEIWQLGGRLPGWETIRTNPPHQVKECWSEDWWIDCLYYPEHFDWIKKKK